MKDNQTLLSEAFSDDDFQNNLQKKRLEIEVELKKFVKWLLGQLNVEQKIFENLESRVKTLESFQEKICRNDYINKWVGITEDVLKNQEIICLNLPDLIGFRLNCFFIDDEISIYKYLKQYYNDIGFEEITLNFDESKKQKNGHNIYKLTGQYQKQFNFEVQIKSLMHNIWGEVEHKTVYKNQNYDINTEPKKVITEEVFNILRATDKQLVALFKNNYTQKQLIQALFFEQTKKEVEELFHTKVLAIHYSNFFELFGNKDFSYIEEYTANKLLKKKFVRHEINLKEGQPEEYSLKNGILLRYYEYEFRVLYVIAKIIYRFESYDQFLIYLCRVLLEDITFEHEEDLEDDIFSDAEDSDGDQEVIDAVAPKLNRMFRERK